MLSVIVSGRSHCFVFWEVTVFVISSDSNICFQGCHCVIYDFREVTG